MWVYQAAGEETRGAAEGSPRVPLAHPYRRQPGKRCSEVAEEVPAEDCWRRACPGRTTEPAGSALAASDAKTARAVPYSEDSEGRGTEGASVR